MEAENPARVAPDMTQVQIPAAEYAVFTAEPADLRNTASYDSKFTPAIKALWKYIFEEWLPAGGYEYDEGKLDFEFYDEHCHFRADSTMDIYIPVKKREE